MQAIKNAHTHTHSHTHTHTHSGSLTNRLEERGRRGEKEAANMHHRRCYCIIDNGKENSNETFEAIKKVSLTSSIAIAS